MAFASLRKENAIDLALNSLDYFRYLRETLKAIDELEKSQSTWKNNPRLAMRNNAMLKRYKNQAKVSITKPSFLFSLFKCAFEK